MKNKKFTTDFKSNLKITIQALIIDCSYDKQFNLFDYLNIQVSQQLIDVWNRNEAIPFVCEAECTLMSDNIPISPPITVVSNQLMTKNSTFPDISILHNIKRQEFIFSWDSNSVILNNPVSLTNSLTFNVEFPVFYSELPSDSIISITFYACFFQTPKQKIGTVTKKLFTTNSKRLKTGIYSLGLENSNRKTSDDLNRKLIFRYMRRTISCIDKCFAYEPYDNSFRRVAELLHPDDAFQYFNSLLNPEVPPKLSNYSKFVHIYIQSPDCNSLVIFNDLQLMPISRDFVGDLYHFSKEQNCKKKQRKFAQIRKIPPLSDIPTDYCNFITNNIDTCLKDPSLYSALFRSVEWDNQNANVFVSNKIDNLDPIDIEYALEFFTDRFEIQSVRRFAVRCIAAVAKDKVKRKDITLFLPQIIQACKANFTNGLSEILIGLALEDVAFASRLYWLSVVESHQIIVKMINDMRDKLKAHDKSKDKEIEKQINLFEDIQKMLSIPKSNTPKLKKQEEIKSLLNREFNKLTKFETPILSPLDPSIKFIGMDPNDVKVFASNKSPVALVFNAIDNDDPKKTKKIRMMFKIGDDIRQDQLILQLFNIMDKIFKASELDLCITTYNILAISDTFGCMEFVENSQAIKDIDDNISDEKTASNNLKQISNSNIENMLMSSSTSTESSNSKILIYLKMDKPGEQEFKKRMDTYTRSLAGFSVMTFILIIGDRHDNNILVTQDGHFLHIDFGFIFGDDAKPLTQPVKIRAEYLLPIASDISVALKKVLNFAGPAFNAVRKHGRLILTLIKLMTNANISCLQEDKNPDAKLKSIQQSLMLNLTEIEAMKALKSTFIESIKSKLTTLYDTIHSVAMLHK